MTTKEKARAYDETLNKARKVYEGYKQQLDAIEDKKSNAALLFTGGITTLECQFPELKESEDERIRKGLLYVIEHHPTLPTEEAEEYIAWLEKQGEHANFRNNIQIGDKVTRNEDGVLVNLSKLNRVAKKDEKQGEQKPADKIEPKFKIGDWAVSDLDKMTRYISEVHNDKYNNYYVIKGDVETECNIDEYDRLHHLWTIQDAKDGDVLVNWNNTVFIFKAIEDETVKFHIAYNGEKWDAVKTPSTKLSHLGLPEPQFEFHPATKEQRELLFQKIREKGYEWDADRKELKKIEQKPAEWSEEDSKRLQRIIDFLWYNRKGDTGTIYQQEQDIDWLKSLRPQKQWKPSEEQIEALKLAYEDAFEVPESCVPHLPLKSLYNDLKQL